MDLQQRQKSCEILTKSFESTSLVATEKAQELAKAVEEAVYSVHKSTGNEQDYRDHIFSLFSNIKSNKNLTRKLQSGELTPVELAQMSAEEMRTRRQKRSDERIVETLIQQEIVADRQAIQPRPSPDERRNEGDLY